MTGKPWSVFDPVEWHGPRESTPSRAAEGRAALDALWAKERAGYAEKPRTPEAVCRGYNNRHAGPSVALPEDRPIPLAPGDDMAATRAWLRYSLAKVPCLAAMHCAETLELGATRSGWRAAAAVMLARPRGSIEVPMGYLAFCVRELLERRIRDPRGTKGYFASDTWPRELMEFALVPVPVNLLGN